MIVSLTGADGHSKKHEMADCFENLKTGIYQRVIKEWDQEKPIADRDYFKLFNIHAGAEFTAMQATPENEVTMWNAMKWFVETPFNPPTDIPKALQIGKKLLAVPKDLRMLSIGQNIHLRQLLEKSKFLEENISIATAIYLQPAYDSVLKDGTETPGKFDYDRALELENVIADMPIYQTYPIGFFLLTNALLSGQKPIKGWLPTLNSLKLRLRRMFRLWQRPVGSPLSHP